MTDALELEAEAERVAERIRKSGQWVSYDLRVLPETAADLLGMSAGTLRNWRFLDRGPKPVQVGGRISYRLTDLLAERKVYVFE